LAGGLLEDEDVSADGWPPEASMVVEVDEGRNSIVSSSRIKAEQTSRMKD
jgi:hypothetical protein